MVSKLFVFRKGQREMESKRIFKIRHACWGNHGKCIEYECKNGSHKQVRFKLIVYGKGRELLLNASVVGVSVAEDYSWFTYTYGDPNFPHDYHFMDSYIVPRKVKRYEINDNEFHIYLKSKWDWGDKNEKQ